MALSLLSCGSLASESRLAFLFRGRQSLGEAPQQPDQLGPVSVRGERPERQASQVTNVEARHAALDVISRVAP